MMTVIMMVMMTMMVIMTTMIATVMMTVMNTHDGAVFGRHFLAKVLTNISNGK